MLLYSTTLHKDYKTLSGSMRQQLLELGFEVTEEGKHYSLTYYGDGRYKTTIAKTGSEWREGKNIASVIIKNMMQSEEKLLCHHTKPL